MEAKTIEVGAMSKNALGTITVDLKLQGMRKFQDFSFLPIKEVDKTIVIQSLTRIGKVTLEGHLECTNSYQGGAFFHHLAMCDLTDYQFSESDWKQIVDYIKTTASANAGSSFVKTDNSGAKSIFDL